MGNFMYGRDTSEDTVINFDINRYLGRWFQIANLPLIYENDCNGAIADYSWNKELNGMRIINTCLVNNEEKRSREGIAFIEYNNKYDRSKLKVKFIDDGPKNDFYSWYYVLYTDYCNYSIVGSPCKKYLWILSREPKIPRCDFIKLCDFVLNKGYCLDSLQTSYDSVYNCKHSK